MGKSRYVGYVGGVAVAVGVGAAIAATGGQGTANADADRSDSAGPATTSQVDAGPKKPEAKTTSHTRPRAKLGNKVDDAADAVSTVPSAAAAVKPTAAAFEAAQTERLQKLFSSSNRKTRAAAVTTDPVTTETPDSQSAPAASETTSVPWSPNPFRPMPPEPAPNDMPGVIWNLEQAVVNAFPDFFRPLPREAFEAGYRLTQMIPWVNVVVPLSNIGADLPATLAGDKNATQRIVNNLIVTIHPVAVLYYGYNEIADVLNLEQEALDLQTWAITTAWDILDPFQLLHNRGQSGLPLSTTTPPAHPPTALPSEATVTLAAAAKTADTQSATADETTASDPNPFRAVDPWPVGMPASVLDTEKAILAAWPAPLAGLAPLFREAYEAVYRGTQIVPWVNVVVPVSEIVPAILQAASGDRAGAQIVINQLLLTTGPVSLLYYGLDELADLLNIEGEAQAAKENLYITLWNSLDPAGLLHVPGESGLPV